MTKCDLGFVFKPDGENELDPCIYKTTHIYRNATVIVSECTECGNIDVSWIRQDNTIEE